MEVVAANHSLQPTPVGVVSSAHAGHVVVPAWLSLSFGGITCHETMHPFIELGLPRGLR